MRYKFQMASAAMVVGAFLLAISTSGYAASEWDKTVAAAKKEGKVVIMGPAGADVRDGLTKGFQKKYPDIKVAFSGMSGSQVAPKLLTEISARVYSTDIVIAGTTTAILSLIPGKALVPMQPHLVGPSTQDPSKWWNGKIEYSDKTEKFNLVFGGRVQVAFVYNPKLVPAGTIRSWKDLLDPKWKGKIGMRDPRRAGAALGWVTYWYVKKELGLGKEFVRQFFAKQDVFVSNDERQLLDFIARERFPLAIGPSGVLAFEYHSKGLPVNLFGSAELIEGGVLSASNGTLGMARNAPHPNAAKVYINYLLSREGQTAWSKGSGLTSRRLDVPRDHLPPALVPKAGVHYLEDYKEDFVILRDEVVNYLRSIL